MPKVFLRDVVERVKNKIDKDATDLEFYIGGEHFEYGEVVISKKAHIMGSTIGPAFHMHFIPGDVLLMSRNPHLRKAGMVDFEGICSDVSYVCRTKSENLLLQEYLPFIFQTDQFWEFAEANKKGSTNFFLNWTDFARYEFFLPEIEQQGELTKLLWAAVATKASYQRLLVRTDELVRAQFVEMFGEPHMTTAKYSTQPLGELTVNFDKCRKPVKDGDRKLIQGPYPYYGATGIVDYINDYRLDGTYLLISEDGKALEFRNYDIAFIVSGKIWVNNHAHVLQCKDCLNMTFLQRYIKYLDISFWVTGIDQKKLNRENMDTIPIMLPPITLQEKYERLVQQADKSKSELKQAIESINGLIKSLMQQDFS